MSVILSPDIRPVLYPNHIILNCYFSATGDGTGGVVYSNLDLNPSIPIGSECILLDCMAWQNNAANAYQSIGFQYAYLWENQPFSQIKVSKTTDRATNGTYWFTEVEVAKLPKFLGKLRTESSANLDIQLGANVNAKTYIAWIKFKLIPPNNIQNPISIQPVGQPVAFNPPQFGVNPTLGGGSYSEVNPTGIGGYTIPPSPFRKLGS